ncbi:MAG: hypothetical protein AAF577_00820 [Pseudomonadota bacterium]
MRWLRWIARLFVVGAVVAVGLAGGAWAFLLEDAPRVTRIPDATPRVAEEARAFVRSVRDLDKETVETPILSVSLDRLQAVMDFAARLVPGARGTIANELGAVTVRGSLPIPFLPARNWLNAEAVVAPYAGRPSFDAVRVGELSIPAALATDLLEVGGNLAMGDEMGSRVRDAVPLMRLDGDTMTVGLVSTPGMRSSFTRRTFGFLRSGEMPTPERIRHHYVALRRAMDGGELPASGSFMPYLHWAIDRAAAAGRAGLSVDTETTAVLFALTQTCGAAKFGLVVGRLVEGVQRRTEDAWQTDCREITFRGAIDKRRHFITAATLKAASTMRVSFAIGEFKELVDSFYSRGRFDFTDIVANASGIRFAETLMATEVAAWPVLKRRLAREDDVLASFDQIPGEIPWSEFERRFDSVDSPAYQQMVTRIERRIDGLAFHEGRPPWDGSSLNPTPRPPEN